MQRLEVSGAVRPIYGSLGVKRLILALRWGLDSPSQKRETQYEHLVHVISSADVSRRLNAQSETGQLTVCRHNLTLGALSSRSALSVLVGALFKKVRSFFEQASYS